MSCSVAGCSAIATRIGLCNAHYLRKWRYGDPLKGGTPRGMAQKFILDNVNHSNEVDCLIWPFCRNNAGYGDVNFPNIEGLAHRVMCFLAHGKPINPDDEAAHSCGNGHSGCINPHHLSWKTRIQNIHDKKQHGTQPSGADIHFAKLNSNEALEIKYSLKSNAEMADKFNVSTVTIKNIRDGRTWKDLP